MPERPSYVSLLRGIDVALWIAAAPQLTENRRHRK
jgi:hypothetical protein